MTFVDLTVLNTASRVFLGLAIVGSCSCSSFEFEPAKWFLGDFWGIKKNYRTNKLDSFVLNRKQK